jgi:hypothetical protein
MLSSTGVIEPVPLIAIFLPYLDRRNGYIVDVLPEKMAI